MKQRILCTVWVLCACGGGETATPAVEITPESASLAPRERLQLSAAVTGGTGRVVWSSSDEAVATVSAGRVEALAAGRTTVRAAVEGTSASDEVMVTVRPGPEARWGHALAHDAARREVVLVGGSRGDVFLGDTWLWNGTAWRRADVSGPPARDQHLLVYDAVRERVVLFGGRAPDGLLSDTWEWNGATWESRATAGPPGREHQGGGWDAAHGRVVLHGGQLDNEALTDTWTWDGTTWTRAATGVPVAGRQIPSRGATFSTTRGALLLAVGNLPADACELWSWDGASWSVVPAGRLDADAPLLLADGGAPGEALGLDEGAPQTWRWDGAAWSRVSAASPPPRFIGAMARDAARGEVVLFGGAVPGALGGYRGDTWVWNGAGWLEQR